MRGVRSSDDAVTPRTPAASEPPGAHDVPGLWAALRACDDPVAMLRAALRDAVAGEREKCAFLAETAPAPDERMPWRYRLRFRLRPEAMTRAAIHGVRRSIAARLRDRRI